MTVYLSFLVCLIAQPATCERVELPVDSLAACAVHGQHRIAEHLGAEREPGWRLEGGWRCVVGQRA